MARIRELTNRNRGRAFKDVVGEVRRYMLGWLQYFTIGATEKIFDELDGWVRRRLRCLVMKQRHPRGSRSRWAMGLCANSELTVAWFDSIGLPRLWKGDLNNTNRRMRTSMSGGVGGVRSTMIGPYPDGARCGLVMDRVPPAPVAARLPGVMR